MATPAASVTTASCTPRTRRAGTATSSPSAVAASAAASSDSGNGSPVPIFDRTKPAEPANAACASEIWPTKPVSTTSDSAMSATIIDVITPNR